MLPMRFQRVRVKEPIASKRYTGEKCVIQCTLQHIIIPGVAVQQKEPVVPIHIGYRGASLIVGRHIRQLIRFAKGLAIPVAPIPPVI